MEVPERGKPETTKIVFGFMSREAGRENNFFSIGLFARSNRFP